MSCCPKFDRIFYVDRGTKKVEIKEHHDFDCLKMIQEAVEKGLGSEVDIRTKLGEIK